MLRSLNKAVNRYLCGQNVNKITKQECEVIFRLDFLLIILDVGQLSFMYIEKYDIDYLTETCDYEF